MINLPSDKAKAGEIPVNAMKNSETADTAQKMKFSIKDLSSKCDQIRSFMRIWSHLLEKSLMENFIFCAVLFELTN